MNLLETVITILLTLGLLLLSMFFLFRKKPKVEKAIKRVEEYHIEILETEGFKNVILRFKMGSGEVQTFELHPIYAHKLSDEICIAAARARKPPEGND